MISLINQRNKSLRNKRIKTSNALLPFKSFLQEKNIFKAPIIVRTNLEKDPYLLNYLVSKHETFKKKILLKILKETTPVIGLRLKYF